MHRRAVAKADIRMSLFDLYCKKRFAKTNISHFIAISSQQGFEILTPEKQFQCLVDIIKSKFKYINHILIRYFINDGLVSQFITECKDRLNVLSFIQITYSDKLNPSHKLEISRILSTYGTPHFHDGTDPDQPFSHA